MPQSQDNTPHKDVDTLARPGLFQSVEATAPRTRAFWASVGVHGLMLVVLIVLPLIFTESMRVKYDVTFLMPPPPHQQILEVTHYKQPPPPKIETRPKKIMAPPVKPLLAEIKPPDPKPIEKMKLPDVIEREKPAPIVNPNVPQIHVAEPTPAPPTIEVRTNVFSNGSSAKPTVNLPAQKVQTGGFGDPNGARGEGIPGKTTNIASLGSFDLPVGAGAGNGTGGANGIRGTVASAGFGNGTASNGSGGSGTGGSAKGVRQGSFNDVDTAQPTPAVKHRDLGPPQTPVEILFKPRPEYTEEARNKKLEGEVLVRVLFTAAGEARILDVMRGLGYGLDENATRAAQQIRFKPAQRDGKAVDSTATVHIVFQLAY